MAFAEAAYGGFKLTIGRTSIAGRDLYTNEAIAGFVPKNGSIDRDFLFYALPLAADGGEADLAIKGRTLNKAKLIDLDLLLPPLPEQKKIAAILSSVDEAIQATQAVIDQTRQVKEGLLQDLLTRGIGHTRFKHTEIGEIPEGWEVRELGDIATVVTGRTPPVASPEMWGTAIPFVTPGDLSDDSDLVSVPRRAVSDAARGRLPLVPPESVLVVCIGATIGKVAVADSECAFNQQINAVVPKVPGKFLYHVLLTRRRQMLALAGNQAVPIINKSTFSGLLVPVPPPAEQREISQRLASVDSALTANRHLAHHLRRAKSGLLADLLTGKVRVTP